uniref:Cuticular protein RR2 family member 4 [Nasonia vitripennis] n=1 Tax=Lepeophtheirus salmonis TaxID=72036 RepID=A0A0K2TLV6_LEPSM
MIFKAILFLALASIVSAGSPRFIQAPIRISDFSGLRAIPLRSPIRFDTRKTRVYQTPTLVQRASPSLRQLISLSPTVQKVQKERKIDPGYNFGYSVSDTLTGDTKTREETRDGDVVRGSYSVADPDGRIRTVTYTADAENGFQAKVTYDGKEGPVSIANQPPRPIEVSSFDDSAESLFGQIENDDRQFDDSTGSFFGQLGNDNLQFDDSDAVIIEGRKFPKSSSSRVQSESLSLFHPVSIPQSNIVRLQRFPLDNPSSFPYTSHFVTSDGRIIEATPLN